MARKLYILGICGTFMGGLAQLARALGWEVAGCDAKVYPPMSDQLRAAGIQLDEGYLAEHLPGDALIVVGNAMSRGNPTVEAMLDRALPYTSGPAWLAEHVLAGRWVLAVSGTHGKTSVSSMLSWLLEDAGLNPGFLIGGVPGNFGVSARLGGGSFFVVEADEYDTAFFDKRAKFVHYRPRTVVINNLEFDHADIYPDLAAIERQFHHLLRCVPGSGLIVSPSHAEAIERVVDQGCWTRRECITIAAQSAAKSEWHGQMVQRDGGVFRFTAPDSSHHDVSWSQRGRHNVENALAAIAAARHVGVPPDRAAESLAGFKGVKRRLELVGEVASIRVFDDFAHHPTAIKFTIETMAARQEQQAEEQSAVGNGCHKGRVVAVIEPRSNTMRMGDHRAALAPATAMADQVYWYQPPALGWSLEDVVEASETSAEIFESIEELIAAIVDQSQDNDDIVIMSNGGFEGIHSRLVNALKERTTLR
ncbi:MAG: UDP-N-acetylmuramate:L-alanyl-gamma-D-glutamyl-meso-diaminopimelate ligase [Pseudomonadota bacterium]